MSRAVLLGFHHGFIVITDIGKDTFITARSLKDTDTLTVAQECLVEVIDYA
jgi:aminoglycoside/choline kinase family phosphotransferase